MYICIYVYQQFSIATVIVTFHTGIADIIDAIITSVSIVIAINVSVVIVIRLDALTKLMDVTILPAALGGPRTTRCWAASAYRSSSNFTHVSTYEGCTCSRPRVSAGQHSMEHGRRPHKCG